MPWLVCVGLSHPCITPSFFSWAAFFSIREIAEHIRSVRRSGSPFCALLPEAYPANQSCREVRVHEKGAVDASLQRHELEHTHTHRHTARVTRNEAETF